MRALLNPVDETNIHSQFNPRYPEHTESNILVEEVRRARKSSPKNVITIEAIITCRKTGIKWLTIIFQKVWQERCVLDNWQRAVVVPIGKKKGSKKDCSTYRGVLLLSHMGKIFAKILEQCTSTIVVPLLSESQLGFRKGRGYTDTVFAVRQL